MVRLGIVFTFITLYCSALFAAPVALQPFSYTTDVQPTFTWQADPEAVSYEIEVENRATEEVFIIETGISGTSWVPAGPFQLGPVYRWKVRGQRADASYTEWSNLRGFVPYDPAMVPSIQAPRNILESDVFSFQFTEVVGASYYEIEVYNNLTNEKLFSLSGLAGSNVAWPAATPFEKNVIYGWQVRSVDTNGVASIFSPRIGFVVYDDSQVPEILAPTSFITEARPVFDWSEPLNTAAYEIQIRQGDTQEIIYTSEQVTLTELALPEDLELDQDRAYAWRVRAFSDEGVAGGYSNWQTFLIYDDNFAPNPISPQGQVNVAQPELVWSAVTGAEAYEVRILNSDGQVVFNGATQETALVSSDPYQAQPGQTYTWQVRAINLDTQISRWSDPVEFNRADGVDGQVPVLNPTLAKGFKNFLFTWEEVPGAVSYSLFIANFRDDSRAIRTINGITDIQKQIRVGRVRFQYWIVAYDAQGNASEKSQILSYEDFVMEQLRLAREAIKSEIDQLKEKRVELRSTLKASEKSARPEIREDIQEVRGQIQELRGRVKELRADSKERRQFLHAEAKQHRQEQKRSVAEASE